MRKQTDDAIRRESTAMRCAKALDCGCFWINTDMPLVAEVPHGGFEDYTWAQHVMSFIGTPQQWSQHVNSQRAPRR